LMQPKCKSNSKTHNDSSTLMVQLIMKKCGHICNSRVL
jgi:hypothetical protein